MYVYIYIYIYIYIVVWGEAPGAAGSAPPGPVDCRLLDFMAKWTDIWLATNL